MENRTGPSARWALEAEQGAVPAGKAVGVTSAWESPRFWGAEMLFHQGDVKRVQGHAGVWRCPSPRPLDSGFDTGLCSVQGCCPALECFCFSGSCLQDPRGCGGTKHLLPSALFQNCTRSKVSILLLLRTLGLTPVLSCAVPTSVGIRFHVLLTM